jgi:YNFM family putative membrane transporter
MRRHAGPDRWGLAAAVSGTAVGPSAFAGHRPGEAGFRRLSAGLFAAAVATFALLYATQALLPALSADFGVPAGEAALTVSLATGALAVTLLFAGPLSEALGRMRLIRASLLASGVLGLAGAAAPSLPALLVLRALAGVALAGLPAVATAYLREEVHPAAHARATGLYIGGTGLGGMLGRLLAGWLADLGGWRLGLAGTGALGLTCAALAFALLPASRNFRPAPARPSHLLRLTGRVARDPVLLALYGVATTMAGAFVAIYNAIGFRLTSPPYHLSVGAAGLVFCVYPVGTASAALAGRLADRIGRHVVVPPAAALMAAGVLLTRAGSLPGMVAGLALMTAGFFVVHGISSGWVVVRAHRVAGAAAPAASLYLFAFYLGSSVFGGLAGSVWDAGGWGTVVAMAAALSATGGLFAFGLSRVREPGPEGPVAGTHPA